MSIDELAPALAEELEILGAEALRSGTGITTRLQRDVTALIRRHHPRARVQVRRQGSGFAVRIDLPAGGQKVRTVHVHLLG